MVIVEFLALLCRWKMRTPAASLLLLDTTSYERATESFKTCVMIMWGRIEHGCFHDHKEKDDLDSFSSLTKYGLQPFASFTVQTRDSDNKSKYQVQMNDRYLHPFFPTSLTRKEEKSVGNDQSANWDAGEWKALFGCPKLRLIRRMWPTRRFHTIEHTRLDIVMMFFLLTNSHRAMLARRLVFAVPSTAKHPL